MGTVSRQEEGTAHLAILDLWELVPLRAVKDYAHPLQPHKAAVYLVSSAHFPVFWRWLWDGNVPLDILCSTTLQEHVEPAWL